MLNIALPKGRLGTDVSKLFDKAGYSIAPTAGDDRRLVIPDENGLASFFLVKPSDVAIYVEYGVADAGVVGSDVLGERFCDVYELLDLGVGKCRLAVAAKSDFRDNRLKLLRVATKYPNIAREYFASRRRDIEVIALNGSIELAPILGLSDVILDIVETGRTLKENGLTVISEVAPVSARLIANKAAGKFKSAELNDMLNALKGVL